MVAAAGGCGLVVDSAATATTNRGVRTLLNHLRCNQAGGSGLSPASLHKPARRHRSEGTCILAAWMRRQDGGRRRRERPYQHGRRPAHCRWSAGWCALDIDFNVLIVCCRDEAIRQDRCLRLLCRQRRDRRRRILIEGALKDARRGHDA